MLTCIAYSARQTPLRQTRDMAEGVKIPEKNTCFWRFGPPIGGRGPKANCCRQLLKLAGDKDKIQERRRKNTSSESPEFSGAPLFPRFGPLPPNFGLKAVVLGQGMNLIWGPSLVPPFLIEIFHFLHPFQMVFQSRYLIGFFVAQFPLGIQ